MSASADISSSSFGIASGTRGTNLDVTRAFWRFHLPDGRHGSCLSCLIMSSTARHGDRWLPVLLVAGFLALAVGNGAASPAGGGGHGGGFSGGGHGGFDGGHGGGGFPRGREFGGRGFGARPVPREHDGRSLFVLPYFYDPYYDYDPYYPDYPYNAYCDPYSPYYAPQYC